MVYSHQSLANLVINVLKREKGGSSPINSITVSQTTPQVMFYSVVKSSVQYTHYTRTVTADKTQVGRRATCSQKALKLTIFDHGQPIHYMPIVAPAVAEISALS